MKRAIIRYMGKHSIDISKVANTLKLRLYDNPPLDFWDSFRNEISVWDRLYNWLEQNGEVTPFKSTFISTRLHNKLRLLETFRIQRIHGYCGSALSEALNWSDANKGPISSYQSRPLAGWGCFVVPH